MQVTEIMNTCTQQRKLINISRNFMVDSKL